MKLTGRKSTNIEERAREFPRPMAGSRIGGEAIHSSDLKSYDAWGKQRVKATLKNADSPFKPMLEGMEKAAKQDRLDRLSARSRGERANIPIPTARPDPTTPYKQPKVLRGD